MTDFFNVEVQDAAGELWSALLEAEGDPDTVIGILTAAVLKYGTDRFGEVVALTLVFMSTHSQLTMLSMLRERGVDPRSVREQTMSDLFERAAEVARSE